MNVRMQLACMLFKLSCLVTVVARITITQIPMWPVEYMSTRTCLHVMHIWDLVRHTADVVADTEYLKRLSGRSSALGHAVCHAPLLGLLHLRAMRDPLVVCAAFVCVLWAVRFRMFRLAAISAIIPLARPYDEQPETCLMMLVAFLSGHDFCISAGVIQEFMLLSLTLGAANEARTSYAESFTASASGTGSFIVVQRDGFWTAMRKMWGW